MFKFLFQKSPQSQSPPEHAVREKAFKQTKNQFERKQLECNMRFAHTNLSEDDRRLVHDSTLNDQMVYDGKGLAAVARSSKQHHL